MSPAARPLALTAARDAFPDAEIIEVSTVEEARRRGGTPRSELLVLAEPDAGSAAQAIQPLDASGMPRWAVVMLGGDLADLAETVPREDWNRPLLARVFRSALMQHELLCENIRLQGDLKSVARRISHDLYTPVGCIYTSSHVLKVILSAEELPSIAVMVRNIEDSSAEISQIVERVSFVLRATVDAPAPVSVDVGIVVAGVLRQLEGKMKEAGATLALPASWPEISGVSQWLHVIWWNLLGNVLKHGGARPEARLTWTGEGDGYRFSITDRGPGVAPREQWSIFQPFCRGRSADVTAGGVGLGLALALRWARLLGGTLTLHAGQGCGARFRLTLPM